MFDETLDLEDINTSEDPLRDFTDNSIGNDSKEVVERELKAFEESNDNGVINSMYKTELEEFYKAWNEHKKQAQKKFINWKYNPIPAMKANRFYTAVFKRRI